MVYRAAEAVYVDIATDLPAFATIQVGLPGGTWPVGIGVIVFLLGMLFGGRRLRGGRRHVTR